MAQMLCCLCTGEVTTPEYDLQKTFTSCSQTSLLVLLQSCIDEECFITNYLICKMCYLLLNELDNIKLRVKNIEYKLRTYMCKYYKSNCIEQRDARNVDTVTEEDTDHLKEVSIQNLKETNLEINHINLDDSGHNLKTEAVKSIIDMNPSLDDITWLSSEETLKKIKKNDEKKNLTKKKVNDLDNAKPYVCTECPKTWRTLTKLKNHLLSHNDEKPYVCEICGQAYKRQQALTIHVGMHKGINPYTCIYCKKSFTQKGALARHTPIHTGEFPFQCDLCGKRFVHHTSFNIHKLSHSGEKSYKCERCGLFLLSGSHLKRHMKVHTGEKRFSCGTCGKKFAERYNLAVHEKLHLGVSKKKKYQCHICGNIYGGQVMLQEHLFNVHQKIQYPNTPKQSDLNL
ncbi:hypothetical protein Zmor_004958 [Zophobas morio]|uniref:C2H2-type domain-containing protein n=2 Tax=Zophobas morio TaxID=2755281 RepID=A0AA38ISI3_9CUCU|nr:hypothetical protein Zmor_004958 [Zophobas morio]